MSPRAVERLWRAIVKRAGRCDYAELSKQAPFIGAYDNPFALLSTDGHACAAHMTRLSAPWDTFYAGKRSSKSRRRLREKYRSLERQGPVEIRFAELAADRRAIADWLIGQKDAQLSADGVSNAYAQPAFRAFVRAVAGGGVASDQLKLAALEVDGTPAAVCMGLTHGNRFYYVTAAYDAAQYGRYSPGQILLARVMERAVADGLDWFDFTIGDEGYKADWCDVTMDMSNGFVPFTARGYLAVGALVAFMRAKAAIKANKRLFSLARQIRYGLRNIFLGPRIEATSASEAERARRGVGGERTHHS
jgi:CelD/BcsL family acetyltransferase involved in cellulose biosynthesis